MSKNLSFTMHKLTLHQLSKSFSGKPVLQDISFRVPIGKVMVLLGASGSGKSTLLRCINLLETPDSGTLQIDETTLAFPSASEDKAALRSGQLLSESVSAWFFSNSISGPTYRYSKT